MQALQLYDGKFLTILWDESMRLIGIDWKESTATMTDEDFKADLILFAGYVEQQKAIGILADVTHFRHQIGPDVQAWRVRNISRRYSAAGVRRFAFLLPGGAQIPPMRNKSAPGEEFLTQGFTRQNEAVDWLIA
jgi:hypothetical protein